MIRTEGLSVRYEDGRLPLYHISLTVCTGEVYCLIGPRGGQEKTTLHNAFLGLVAPTMGKAFINGLD